MNGDIVWQLKDNDFISFGIINDTSWRVFAGIARCNLYYPFLSSANQTLGKPSLFRCRTSSHPDGAVRFLFPHVHSKGFQYSISFHLKYGGHPGNERGGR